MQDSDRKCLHQKFTVDSRAVSDYWSSSVQCRYWRQATLTNEFKLCLPGTSGHQKLMLLSNKKIVRDSTDDDVQCRNAFANFRLFMWSTKSSSSISLCFNKKIRQEMFPNQNGAQYFKSKLHCDNMLPRLFLHKNKHVLQTPRSASQHDTGTVQPLLKVKVKSLKSLTNFYHRNQFFEWTHFSHVGRKRVEVWFGFERNWIFSLMRSTEKRQESQRRSREMTSHELWCEKWRHKSFWCEKWRHKSFKINEGVRTKVAYSAYGGFGVYVIFEFLSASFN